MTILYSTKVTATGGRKGTIRSEDGILDLTLALPKELGGMGGATNPEQLFAGGYAACFENALLRVARESGHRFADGDVEVVAEIGLSRNEANAFVLHAALAITLAGVDQAMAEQLVHGADAICPYSNAIRGNVDVTKTVTVR
ncbi:MAG TPA: organic hydroperoxide resistance protein [Xanthobacteraceae bacterium]|jgi:Ohr subfamily peroxiredoxin|uniref:organic hydroperoxide resistance protein n=1 Tax=Roseixanthobacter finlandensis TaxID=3119922 RepID=UPI002C334C71|nr:organic hydroperoxide resistance protein [Xanthobacteraceae bacterium]HQS47630.1 organic hydroperoxide resistance protein [Xanthobacteraceae bacterium]